MLSEKTKLVLSIVRRVKLNTPGLLVLHIFEILFVYDTPIIIVENDIAFKAFFRILMKREERGGNDKLPTARWYRKRVRSNLPEKDCKRYLVSSIPNIGDILATNLLNHFGTVTNIANATIEELKTVPKIGRKKAKLIYEIFH